MKKFIKLVSIFIFLFFSLIFLLDFLTSYIINKHANFELKNKPKYIMIGHSHTECAYNDSLITDFKNLGRSGENYFYSYPKIKKLLEQNNDIETVFLEYANNTIGPEMNEWVWDTKFMSHNYPLYSSFLTLNQKTVLLTENLKGFCALFGSTCRNNIDIINNSEYNYISEIGGYLFLKTQKVDSLLTTLNPNLNSTTEYEISEINLEYLKKTIELCQRYNKKVILVRTPTHTKYQGYKNEQLYKDILKTRFKNIKYIDFSKFPLNNDNFADLEHLNYKGANKFSKWFQLLLIKKSLLNKNAQEIIDFEITKINERF